MEAGPDGNVQSQIILKKDVDSFTVKEGWAFPRKVCFNGDQCMMPPPDSYPYLNSAHSTLLTILPNLAFFWVLVTLAFFLSFNCLRICTKDVHIDNSSVSNFQYTGGKRNENDLFLKSNIHINIDIYYGPSGWTFYPTQYK
ncbi:hypothetical protein L484_012675 [Morus notabilis]|uniref:COBRA C-terminal domain-containing protein n=1 Tax=Morus notabilis TaxID=981085 RepID=W9QK34_9ROSA|nr:hypothetical protein L484_012675 [Morus notabilis]